MGCTKKTWQQLLVVMRALGKRLGEGRKALLFVMGNQEGIELMFLCSHVMQVGTDQKKPETTHMPRNSNSNTRNVAEPRILTRPNAPLPPNQGHSERLDFADEDAWFQLLWLQSRISSTGARETT